MFCAVEILRAHGAGLIHPQSNPAVTRSIFIRLSIKLIPGAFIHDYTNFLALFLNLYLCVVSAKLTPLFFATTEKIEESSYFLNITKCAMKHALRKIMVELKCKVNEVANKNAHRKRGV